LRRNCGQKAEKPVLQLSAMFFGIADATRHSLASDRTMRETKRPG
jgi:hypothetical protein